MRYRTKLSIALVGLTAISCGLLLWLVYRGASNLLFRQVQGRVLAIASTGALNFPVEEHERLRSRADETGADYLKVEKHLRAVRDTNQDPDMRVIFVYTMRPSTTKPGSWDYIADGEEQGSKDKSHVGDPVSFQGIAGTELRLDKAKANPDYTMDEFGVWLTASVPLRDASGKPVAVMAVDVAADSVRAEMRRMLFITMGAVAIASVLSLLASLKLAKWASSPLTLVKATLDEISSGNLGARIDLDRDDEFGEVGRSVNRMALSLQERATLKGALSRQVPGQVAERIASSRDLHTLTGSQRRITVLFCDIHHFTRLSSTLEPGQAFGFLNEFFEEMVEAVFQHHGTLDKMLGDGLMALFGAPQDDPDHALHALEAAMNMQERFAKLQQKWLPRPAAAISIGIGLHTGEALVGNLGSKERMEYTAIGETVRIAAQLQAATEENRCSLLLSRETAGEIPVHIPLRQVAMITLRGMVQSTAVFTPRPTDSAQPPAGA